MGKAFPYQGYGCLGKQERELPVPDSSEPSIWAGTVSHAPGKRAGPGSFRGLSSSAIVSSAFF